MEGVERLADQEGVQEAPDRGEVFESQNCNSILWFLSQVETEWSDVKRQNVGFQLDHIKSTFITAIRTQTIVQKRLSVLLLE